ncbi:VOC family protein [Aeromicrobium sp. UC242_57]|uniref:VOC family protein n=1 Tax=Aeromicrobium sp. UC242_57 TaxID=3374624 RepID=UPI0037A1DFF0
MTAMFVNLPVTDLERAKAFYTALGFTINPKFTDHNAACVVVEEDHSDFMILVRESSRPSPIFRSAIRPSTRRSPSRSSRTAAKTSTPSPTTVWLLVVLRRVLLPTTGSCTSASSPTPTATSSKSAGWTRVAAEQGPEAAANTQA